MMPLEDVTMRIVWFNGRAYPVTAHPLGLHDRGTHWHVQTEDGAWHPIVEREPAARDSDAWPTIAAAIAAWLTERKAE